jgi:c(7)-type cytochrome triheme protein
MVISLLGAQTVAEGSWQLPYLPPKEEYGNILLNRISQKNNVKAVSFSHWIHRRKHTCRVCHSELGFNMETNTTEITEDANRAGQYCGACHDGTIAFGHDKANCAKCHTGQLSGGKARFPELINLPLARFGNRVDWVSALKMGLIKPAGYIKLKPDNFVFGETLLLEAEMGGVAPAIFPHKAHTDWLDCNNCHPDIFNIKKKTTRHFSMEFILKGRFCGACHLTVAFPINDCKRCHPKMSEEW